MWCGKASFCVAALMLQAAPLHGLQLSETMQGQERSLLAAWSANLDHQGSGKQSPLQRVVQLLREMKAQLEKEAEEDAQMYDENVCWCETNDKEKTKAIADADAKITDLTSEIEERSGRGAELTTEIEHLGKTIQEETHALAQAVAMREKEYGEFTQSEKDMVQAVTMLKNAILVLSKHHSGFIQLTAATSQSLQSVLQFTALKYDEMVAMKASRTGAEQRTAGISLLSRSTWTQRETVRTKEAQSAEASLMRVLRGALQGTQHAQMLPVEYAAQILAKLAGSGTALVQQPLTQSYAPQSGQIFGILNQMKEEFESNLSTAQKEEVQAQAEFVELKATKEEQIAAAKKMKDKMDTEMWANKKALTDAKEDLESTREQFKADKQFLSDLRLTCQKIDHEWKVRSKSRKDELEAVSDTIGILTEDEARTLMAKTVTFLQVQTHKSSALRSHAAKILRAAAAELAPVSDDLLPLWHGQVRPDTQLSALSTQVQLDAFTKVKEAMDKMIAELKAQQQEEVKKKEFCRSELNENEKQTYTTEQHLEDVKNKIAGLEATIETLTKEIEEAKVQIADTQVQIKAASEARKKENQEFQVTVSDQRATQAILQKAIDRLKLFYNFLQTHQEPVPPHLQTAHKKNAGGKTVMSFLEQIIEDSKAVEKDATDAEQEAQKSYAGFVNDANNAVETLQTAIMNKQDNIASATVEKENAEMEQQATEEQLEGLIAYAGELHKDCDFTLKNFDLRQGARLKEIEAIQEAKAILSGMSSSSLEQESEDDA